MFQFHFSQERTVLECAALVRNIEFTLKGVIPSELAKTLPKERKAAREPFVEDPSRTECDDIRPLAQVKKDMVLKAAFCLKGNLMQVAKALKISKAQLYRNLTSYGWKRDHHWTKIK